MKRTPGVSLFLIAFGVVALMACTVENPESGPIVETKAGSLEGLRADEGAGISVFRGVPFAKPPLGELRWRPPAPVEPWDGVKSATEFSPACWQPRNADDSPYARGELVRSEDCLTLNVWSPVKKGGRLPVMVWFHGGGHTSGVGSAKIFDGTAMARKGVLMVTANYRLGPLGFMAHPALTAESEHASSGNYGLLDHVATLKWVRDNIAAFGGDPSNVTIFGQSAGSWSVCLLQASPLARGLFHKAIGHSGGCFGAPRPHLAQKGGKATETSGHDGGLALAAKLGIEGEGPEAASALRAASPEDVIATGVRTGAVVDGWVLPKLADEIFAAGEQNDVQLIVGSMSDEGSTLFASYPETPHEEFVAGLRRLHGTDADKFLAAYKAEIDESTRTASQAIAADRLFTWQMRAWARATQGKNDVYRYFFSHAPPVFRLYIPDRPKLDFPDRGAGAYHSGDLAFAFGNVGLVGTEWNDREREIANEMSGYWANFAKTGDPNGEGLPRWPRYQRESETALEFGCKETKPVIRVRQEKLDLFDRSYGAEPGS